MNRRIHHPQASDPWELVWGQPYIDSQSLAAAIEGDLKRNPHLDFRTRLLVGDAARALRSFWGSRKFARWLEKSPVGETIHTVLKENPGRVGFHFIRRRLVTVVTKDQIEQIFELLAQEVRERVEVTIAGSVPTLIRGLTARPTDAIDFVNEVPAQIRNQKKAIDLIKSKYGLLLGHVQSHYLPANWMNRRQYLGEFGRVRVYLADVYDIFVSKLSSNQEKHKDDLRVMAPKLDRLTAKRRLKGDGKAFLESPAERATIEENWRFIYRQPLFSRSRPTGSSGMTPEGEMVPKKKGRKRKNEKH
jgi:Nucleotidyltransferase of unknown function (DUF6036)